MGAARCAVRGFRVVATADARCPGRSGLVDVHAAGVLALDARGRTGPAGTTGGPTTPCRRLAVGRPGTAADRCAVARAAARAGAVAGVVAVHGDAFGAGNGIGPARWQR